MFDENGEPYRRRSKDPIWRFFIPVAGTALISLVGWGVSVETRINRISVLEQERATFIEKLEVATREPPTRPEIKIQLEQGQQAIDKLWQRIDRLEERFNNFHQFILQVMPKHPQPPLGKRGMAPFQLEDRG